MNEQQYRFFMAQFSNFLTDLGLPCHNLYGPLTSDYWNQDYKIAIYNLESYDSDREDEPREMSMDLFRHWFGAKTTRNIGVIANAVYSNLYFDQYLSESEIKKSYRDIESLYAAVAKIAYLNFRCTDSPNGVKANRVGIYEEIGITKEYLREQLLLLGPDVVIIGSQIGCALFNEIFDPIRELEYRGRPIIFGNSLVVSMTHTSGQGAAGGWYNEICMRSQQIADFLLRNRKRKMV